MWIDTPVTRSLKIQYPIIQGPFGGGASSVALAATVSISGVSDLRRPASGAGRIAELVVRLRQQTAAPFAVNFWIDNADAGMATFDNAAFARHLEHLKPIFDSLGLEPPAFPNQFGQSYEKQISALIDAAPPVFSFVFGIPSLEILRACKKRGILTIGNATTVDEAQAIEEAGVDMVVATGVEAGGHRVSFLHAADAVLMGNFSLLPQVRKAVRFPVITAGGSPTA